MWGSVAKRLWLKASAQEDVATLRVLYPLFSSVSTRQLVSVLAR